MKNLSEMSKTEIFLSTPSARRATCCHVHPPFYQGISIHALREEGDRKRYCLMFET